MQTTCSWPRADFSRIPNELYHRDELFELEQERVFQGPVWLFMGLEAEIPNPGDFRTTHLGAVPVLYNRDEEGAIHAFVNRCIHRGALVARGISGNAKNHTCVYHQWCYDLKGQLIGVPFYRGVGGVGGVSKEFKIADHRLKKLRVENYHGLLFATFSESAPPLAAYLGENLAKHLRLLMRRPLKVLCYQRQTVRGNWKLYAENVRDQYHGSILHQFLGTFVTPTTQVGGILMDERRRHSMLYTKASKFDGDLDKQDVVHNVGGKLEDHRITEQKLEFGPEYPYRNVIAAVFPNMALHQFFNSVATRQIRPKSMNEFELEWTFFGYDDDDEQMTARRLLQLNLFGPSGFVSSEDGEAIELVQKGTREQQGSVSIVEMGGTGPIPEGMPSRMNELAIRGFWSYYSELMGIEPKDAVK